MQTYLQAIGAHLPGIINVLSIALAAFGAFALSTLLGVIPNALWDLIKSHIQYQGKDWVNVRGWWHVDATYIMADGTRKTVVERVLINKQRGPVFSGILHSPHPDPKKEEIQLPVEGLFKDKFHASFQYCEGNLHTDIGAGVLKLNPSHKKAMGCSANIGIVAPEEPMTVIFTMTYSTSPLRPREVTSAGIQLKNHG